jgi:hypothetical protein
MSIKNREHRTVFKDVSLRRTVLAAEDPAAAPLIAGRAGYTLFIQRIVVHVHTAAAKFWEFKDDNAAPRLVAKLPASAVVGDQHVLLDSDEGVPLTEGKNLDLATDGAGVAGSLVVEAYLKPTGVLLPSQI